MGDRYDPVNLFLVNAYNYENWYKKEESTYKEESADKKEESADLSDMPPLEGDEKIKEGK